MCYQDLIQVFIGKNILLLFCSLDPTTNFEYRFKTYLTNQNKFYLLKIHIKIFVVGSGEQSAY